MVLWHRAKHRGACRRHRRNVRTIRLRQDAQKRNPFSPTHPELLLAALARWYVEPLSEARTLLADFFSILPMQIVLRQTDCPNSRERFGREPCLVGDVLNVFQG